MTYKAIVARIHTRPLPGADNLVIGTCGAYQVIVGKETTDGQLGIFFESDGQISEEFARQNDLVRRKNEDGTTAGGMFEQNRRVRSIKLRGAKSEGFWCPLDKIAYTGVKMSELTDGFQFDELNGHPICNKYFTPATHQARSPKSRKTQRDNAMFHKHIDTGMFKRECHLIPDNAIIYITEKLHGTSQRIGHVLDDVPIQRNWLLSLIAKWLKWPTTMRVWRHIVGSRNVILEHRDGDGFYGGELFRYAVSDGIRLHKGEVVYGEVVGYTDTGAPIMAQHSLGVLKDKSLQKSYGDTIEYSYGCHVGECRFYVYRITVVNEDGVAVDLSWPQVKKRAKELGLECVPELPCPVNPSPEVLVETVKAHTEWPDGTPRPSVLDHRHIREGVVVRYESEHGIGWLKNKAFAFGVLEGYLKESDEYVDAEEVA